MSDRCMRIALALAALPLVFGVWCLASVAHGSSWRIPCIAGTGLTIATSVLIWKNYVRWTVIRSTSTLALSLAALAQVAFWQPLWAIGGCGWREALCTAQSLAGAGIWAVGGALLWWGAVLLGRRSYMESGDTTRRRVMTPNAVRLAIGIALVPFLPGLFWITFFAVHEVRPQSWAEEFVAFLAYTLCAVVAGSVWLLLWRRAVVWTRGRRVITAVLAGVLLLSPLGTLVADAVAGATGGSDTVEAACWLAPLFAYAVWLAGTAWAWRTERPRLVPGLAADAAGEENWATCPECGYSLRGLREVRCPECGWSATVDVIVARSITRVVAVP